MHTYFSRSLYWIETTNDRGIIMQSDLDGRNVQPFFKNINNTCTCPNSSSVMPMMTIDKTNIQKPVIYWVSLEGHLNVADIHGCMCNVVLSAGFKTATLTSLTVDKMNIYWSNVTENRIYFMRKEYPFLMSKENISKPELKSLYLPNVRRITAFGKSLQAYPTTKCLLPRQKAYTVKQVKATATSIVVNLPEMSPEIGCERYSLPSTLYIIRVLHCLKECEGFELRTYERQCEIPNLKPFTEYKLQLRLSNVYIKKFELPTLSGLDVTLKTSPGKPDAPENFTVQALTPTLAAVYWMPPKVLNCAAVHYEVHWKSLLPVNGVLQKGEQLSKEPERTEDGRFFTMLKPLLPGQDYLVYVRVYPVNFSDLYNETLNETIRMYSEPNNLTVSGVSVNSMNISWIPSVNLTIGYTLEYKDVAMDMWQIADSFELKQYKIMYHIRNLQPRTLYKFRLVLRYPAYKENFIWPSDGRFTFQTLGK